MSQPMTYRYVHQVSNFFLQLSVAHEMSFSQSTTTQTKIFHRRRLHSKNRLLPNQFNFTQKWYPDDDDDNNNNGSSRQKERKKERKGAWTYWRQLVKDSWSWWTSPQTETEKQQKKKIQFRFSVSPLPASSGYRNSTPTSRIPKPLPKITRTTTPPRPSY